MREVTYEYVGHELFSAEESFDPWQNVLHALLSVDAESVVFRDGDEFDLVATGDSDLPTSAEPSQRERSGGTAEARGSTGVLPGERFPGSHLGHVRATRILDRIDKKRARRRRLRILQVVCGGAVAACIFWLLLISRSGWEAGSATAAELREIAQNDLDSLERGFLLLDDPAQVALYRRQIDELTKKVALLKTDPERTSDALRDWSTLCSRMRNIGEWDSALREMHSALDYCLPENNPTGKLLRRSHFSWSLAIASTHSHLGDTASALTIYHETFREREEYIASAPSEPVRLARRAILLSTVMWHLSYVSISVDDLAGARQWQNSAEDVLREYFIGVCLAAGRDPGPNATAVSAFWAAPAAYHEQSQFDEKDFDSPIDSLGFEPDAIFKMRLWGHLYREGRLRRVERDFHGAREALLLCRQVPVTNVNRDLDLAWAVEAARVELGLENYRGALSRIEEAEEIARALISDESLAKPINSVVRSEILLLRGGALLGLDRKSAAGREKIRQGLAHLEKLSRNINPGEKALFLKRFDSWRRLLQRLEDQSVAH